MPARAGRQERSSLTIHAARQYLPLPNLRRFSYTQLY